MISMYSLTAEERYLEIINRCPDLLNDTLKELALISLFSPRKQLSRIRRKVVPKVFLDFNQKLFYAHSLLFENQIE
ncbi:hypothetical protein [Bacteroides acidifaciens]|uniref:hypothetical protein n=1 Tax=Bacteroides acidifaciens TaxID=85831 RepID=UPI003F69397C